MRNSLLLTASVAALCSATPAWAGSPSIAGSLNIGMSYGGETAGMESTFWMVNLGAEAEFGITDNISGQAELFGNVSEGDSSSWYGKYGDQMGLSTYGGTLHVNWNVGDFKFGPFLMVEGTTVGDRGFDDEGAGDNGYLAFGGEARWTITPTIDVTGQIGGLFHIASPDGGDNCGSLCDAFFAGAGATWFFDDNTSISANFAYLGGQGGYFWGGVRGQTGWDYGARIEHQFGDSPFAAYLAYDGNSFAWDGYTQHDNVVSVGLKFYINGDSLRQQHDAGGFRTPHFERMINQSLSADDVSY